MKKRKSSTNANKDYFKVQVTQEHHELVKRLAQERNITMRAMVDKVLKWHFHGGPLP